MHTKTSLKRELAAHTLGSRTVRVFAAVLVLVTMNAAMVVRPAQADTATTINFQARLETVAGAVSPDGNYNVEFKLYNAASGGSALWTEDYLNSSSAGVQVINGYLTVNLGSQTGFPNTINWDQGLWLTMNIGGTGSSASWDGEMNPRLKLTAVPYAFKAGQLAQYNSTTGYTSTLSVGGPTVGNQNFIVPDQGAAGSYNLCVQNSSSCGFAASTGSSNYIQNQNASAQTSANFWIDGTGTAATLNATTALQTGGVTRIDDSGNLTNINSITMANGAWINAVDASGTGTINMFKVNANNEIQVGAALNIDGHIVLPTSGGQMVFSDMPVDSTASSGTKESYTMRVGSTNALTVYGESDGSGGIQNVRVGIGNTISPGYALDVSGDINLTGTLRINGTAICTGSGCGGSSGSFISLQTGTPGTAQTGNFNISGTGIAGVLQAGSFDTASSGVLTIGGTNATAITLAQNVTISSGKTLIVNGYTNIQPATNGVALTIATSDFNTVFTVDTSTARVGIGLGGSNLPTMSGQGIEVNGSLRLDSWYNSFDTFTTPQNTYVPTKINIPLVDPGAYGQLLAFGLPSTASSTSRVMSLFDARTTAHQPTLAVFNPTENDIVGLSWNGSNTTAVLQTLSGSLNLAPAGDLVANPGGNIGLYTTGSNTISISAAGGAVGIDAGTGTLSLNTSNAGTGGAIELGHQNGTTTIYTRLIQNSGQVVTAGADAGTTVSLGGQKGGGNTGTGTAGKGGVMVIAAGQGGDSADGTSGAGGDVTIQSGQAGSVTGSGTYGSGGNIYLQAQSATVTNNLSTSSGSVIVNNTANSTHAFQVQSTSAATILGVDTLNGRVGIGNVTPNYTLDVAGDINSTTLYRINGNAVLSVNGTQNVFTGVGAGAANTGSGNSFTGYNAGNANTSGQNNVAMGGSALAANTTGNANTAVGQGALAAGSGTGNTAVGQGTLGSGASGGNNVALGIGAGNLNVTGTGNVFLGAFAGYNETGSNKLYISNSNTSSPLIGGDFSASTLQFNGSTTIGANYNLSFAAGSGSFDMSQSTGTFKTGTGAVSLNGNVTVATGKTLTMGNAAWINAVDASGVGTISMFQVNANNEIQVGAALNVDGSIILPTNGGQMTLSDLPIDSTAASGTPESYTMRVGSTNALTVYGEADGSGNAQNVRVAIGSSIAPAYTLDVGGTINASTSMLTPSLDVASAGTLTVGGITATALTIGNTTAATATTINGGTGTSAINLIAGAGGSVNVLNTVSGTFNLGTNATTHAINIGTGAAAQTIAIGSATSTSKLTLLGGTNTTSVTGVTLNDSSASGQNNLQLDSFGSYNETASTCSTSLNQGAIYYNNSTATGGAIRGCINGAWEDVVSTSSLGILMFGIVPDSGSTNAGDLAAAAGYNSGPCKAYVGASANVVSWNGCTAYTQGRKQVIAAGSATVSTSSGVFQHLCIFTAGSAPTLSGAPNSSETSPSLTVPAFTVGAPGLCLATIKTGSTSNTIGAIYDTRVYTTDTKTFATLATAAPIGTAVKSNGTSGQYAPITATTDMVAGVVVAYSGTTSTTTPNAVIVTSGPIAIKATAGTVGQIIISNGASTGYTITSTTASGTIYANLGIAQSSYSASLGSSCAVNTGCAGSIFTTLNIR